jgi:hypothetical protein
MAAQKTISLLLTMRKLLCKNLKDLVKKGFKFVKQAWILYLDIFRAHTRGTIAVLAILMVIVLLIVAYLPTIQPFEGNLIVSELNFTCRQDAPFKNDHLFIKDLRSVQEIALSSEKQEFKLVGSFTSESEPWLQSVEELSLKPTSTDSQLLLTATSPEDSGLDLSELRLHSGDHVKQLRYDAYNHILSFTLEPRSTKIPIEFDVKSRSLIQATAERHEIDSPKVKRKFVESLAFQFQPTGTLQFNIDKIVKIDIRLGKSNGDGLWGNLTVTGVDFRVRQENATPGSDDDFYNSTIRSGFIQVAHQKLDLEADQFLLLNNESITNLRRLKILPASTTDGNSSASDTSTPPPEQQLANLDRIGLSVIISGQAQKIEVGLDPKLPIKRIESNWLNRTFSDDAITALVSSAFAFIATALVFAVEDFLGKPSVQPNQATNTDNETLP